MARYTSREEGGRRGEKIAPGLSSHDAVSGCLSSEGLGSPSPFPAPSWGKGGEGGGGLHSFLPRCKNRRWAEGREKEASCVSSTLFRHCAAGGRRGKRVGWTDGRSSKRGGEKKALSFAYALSISEVYGSDASVERLLNKRS